MVIYLYHLILYHISKENASKQNVNIMEVITMSKKHMTRKEIPWEIAKKYNDLASGEHDSEKLNELLFDMFDELENSQKNN